MRIENGKLFIPRAKKGDRDLAIDLAALQAIEDRIPEIQRSTPTTLPELIVTFTMGMLQLSRIMALVELEVKTAKRIMDESESIALLENIEKILEEKKVKSSADTRKAAMILDPDFKAAREVHDQLTSIYSFLSGKLNGMGNAYFGAKKICDLFVKIPPSQQFTGTEEDR